MGPGPAPAGRSNGQSSRSAIRGQEIESTFKGMANEDYGDNFDDILAQVPEDVSRG